MFNHLCTLGDWKGEITSQLAIDQSIKFVYRFHIFSYHYNCLSWHGNDCTVQLHILTPGVLVVHYCSSGDLQLCLFPQLAER